MSNSTGGVPLIRPQQIDSLPILDPGKKAQYKTALENIWQKLNEAEPGSQEHTAYMAQIQNASRKIMQQISGGGNMGQQRPQSQQGAPSGPQPNGGQQPQQAQQNRPPTAGQPSQQTPQLTQKAQEYIKNLKIFPPANQPTVLPNTPQYDTYANNVRKSLYETAVKQEHAQKVKVAVQQQIGQLQQSGQEIPEDLRRRYETANRALNEATAQFTNFKASNASNQQAFVARQQAQSGQQNGNVNGGPAPGQQQQPPMQNQNQNQGRQDQSNVMGNQGNVNFNPQNEQQQTSQSPPQPGVSTFQQPNQPAPSHMPQISTSQPQQTPQSATNPMAQQNFNNMAGPRPQINPQQHQQTPTSAVPNSATGQGQVQPLSQQGAMEAAARSYSQQQQSQQTPVGIQGQSFPTMNIPTQVATNTKMPIPKQLNLPPERQQPVQMPPSRPTLNGAGMTQQPGIQKAPGFVLEGEGDRVLSKKKLDELVRQVTGGGENDALSPEVEEAVLTLADDFVDTVITSACRLAKLRQGQTLEIKDLQIVLERNYGIRIPGYSLDEVRTVRKFQPAPGWTQKMNAIQAAKVMGKNDL